ncbi:hypothetical protein BDK51DRAFT_51083 [Blyttiomyces helicus]|uniref:Ser-Thr-rich glycosyl-phosphatidyl-inositol-anchored membrane family-domain-containing protein n=1 Tax=Blyttiomyces helicus TaxID=388810 RepID=A0A4P9WM93_9FUNG|nr:hypothetical protein BDK51DRAFT_51083 [Blyttiomyces helicus]|eukprot:RKO92788.1 hypothetical protein BDK51DRAFT_51083 [Blyttiomyces helicus]
MFANSLLVLASLPAFVAALDIIFTSPTTSTTWQPGQGVQIAWTVNPAGTSLNNVDTDILTFTLEDVRNGVSSGVPLGTGPIASASIGTLVATGQVPNDATVTGGFNFTRVSSLTFAGVGIRAANPAGVFVFSPQFTLLNRDGTPPNASAIPAAKKPVTTTITVAPTTASTGTAVLTSASATPTTSQPTQTPASSDTIRASSFSAVALVLTSIVGKGLKASLNAKSEGCVYALEKVPIPLHSSLIRVRLRSPASCTSTRPVILAIIANNSISHVPVPGPPPSAFDPPPSSPPPLALPPSRSFPTTIKNQHQQQPNCHRIPPPSLNSVAGPRSQKPDPSPAAETSKSGIDS